MTFQPIDQQISVHRTPEQGASQAQATGRLVAEQQMLAGQAAEETERQRSKNTPAEPSAEPHIGRGHERNGGTPDRRQAGKKTKRTEQDGKAGAQAVHPYKGKHIDLTL
jgi:hypothetical protein